ncbi:hypothetical protein EYF80_011559 [Liparis tanakae]|uniref:Uncharacterized protein n=1 Tax=Liparis tanakae TaxID=230148 RepID=A0A4Z2IK23_9TELE|nr:hypothetical protein EYF80_011559 [Liparis tanakae]
MRRTEEEKKETIPPWPATQRDTTLETHVKADGSLTLSVGEVEEQTQDQQQRQQQRGSGSVHGGTAWYQHAFGSLGGAGSQSPVSQSGLISQMQGIHSLCKGKEGWGEGEGEKKKKE